MSHQLQVLIPEALERRIRKAAHRRRLSISEWVREALEAALQEGAAADPLDRLAALGAPTGDIRQMVVEIEAGRDDDSRAQRPRRRARRRDAE